MKRELKIGLTVVVILLLLMLGVLIGQNKAEVPIQHVVATSSDEAEIAHNNSLNTELGRYIDGGKPPKGTYWLGAKWNNLVGVGGKALKGSDIYGINYVDADYALRAVQGISFPKSVPLQINTQPNAEVFMKNLDIDFTESGSMRVNGKKIALYDFDKVAIVPDYKTNRVLVLQGSKKLMKKALAEMLTVK